MARINPMTTLFALSFLAALACLFFGLAKPQKFNRFTRAEEMTRKGVLALFGSVAAVSFIGVGATGSVTQPPTASPTVVTKVSPKVSLATATPTQTPTSTPSPTPSPTSAPTKTPSPTTTPATAQVSAEVVKKSNTGICHAPGTTYYDRTIYFTPFASIDECLASGGRLPLR